MKIDELRKLLQTVGRHYGSSGLEAKLAAEKNDLKLREETRESLLKLTNEEWQTLLEDVVAGYAFLYELIQHYPKVLVEILSSNATIAALIKEKKDFFFNELPDFLTMIDGKDAVEILEALRRQGILLEETVLLKIFRGSLQRDQSSPLTEYLLNLDIKNIQEQINGTGQGKFPNFFDFDEFSIPSPQNMALLVKKGFNINVQDPSGLTLLHMAKKFTDYHNLIRFKADPTIKNKEKHTPFIHHLLNYLKSENPGDYPFLIVHQIKNMSEQDLIFWREYWKKNWKDLFNSNITDEVESAFVLTMAYFDKNFHQLHESVFIAGGVLGVSATIPYPIEVEHTWHKLSEDMSPTVDTEVLVSDRFRFSPFEWLCKLLERYVGEMSATDLDKKPMLEILEAHQFTRDHLQDLDLTQKLFKRHQEGKLCILPNAGWKSHVVGVGMKQTQIFFGNRGGKVANEPFGACQFAAQSNTPSDVLEFMTNVIHSNFSYPSNEKSKELFQGTMARMVDLSKPLDGVPAKRQKHGTCFWTSPLINIQIMLKAFGSLNAHKRYKNMTSKFKDYMVQLIVSEFNQAKQDKNQIVLHVLKIFIRKILVEHYNLNKPEDQEVLRAAELLKLFEPEERKNLIKDVCNEIKEKWILLQLFELDKRKVANILREHDRTSIGTIPSTFEKIDRETVAILLNLSTDNQFTTLFEEITAVFPTHTRQKIQQDAESYLKEVIKPFFDKAVTPEIQEKLLTFSKPLERNSQEKKREAEAPQGSPQGMTKPDTPKNI